jgi:MFS transporter, SP family, galactose:H+ symporter
VPVAERALLDTPCSWAGPVERALGLGDSRWEGKDPHSKFWFSERGGHLAGGVVTQDEEVVPSGPIKPVVYVVAFAAATAGLLFGLDVGVISGAQKFLQADYQSQGFVVTDEVLEHIVSALLFGATAGAVGCGWLSAKLGRKRTLMVSAALFILGSIGCAVAPSPNVLIVLRAFLGLAIGIASFVAPLYLSEVAPQRLRGAMVSMYQLMITIGILLAFMSDTYLAEYAVIGGVQGGHWRWMLGILVIPAIAMGLAVLTLPRSPRWLLLNGKEDEAREVLQKIRSLPEEIEAEIRAIKHAIQADTEVPVKGFALFKSNANFRRAVYLGIGLQVIQQLTGINVIMYYSPRILETAGFASDAQQLWGTVILGLVNVLSTFIAIAFVDRWGRKPIMYAGFITMGLSMAAVGVAFKIGSAPYLAVGGLVVFLIGFAMSAGPIVWILCAEIYPLNGRDFGITVSTATNWIVNGIVGITFLKLLNGLGPDNTFFLYGGLEALFFVFFVLFVPETKGVSLEQISANLLAGKPLREIGASKSE